MYLAATANEPDMVARYLAVAGLMLSIGSLCWQLLQFRLSGARIQVRLSPVVFTVHGHTMRGPDGGWENAPPSEFAEELRDGFIELAVITVVNMGRMPVSVSDITLDHGGARWRPWKRNATAMQRIPIHDGKLGTGALRLEVRESADVYMDYLPVVKYLRTQPRPAKAIRGSATPAGRRRPKLSAFRKRWKLDAADRTPAWLKPDQRTMAFQELFRVVYPRDLARLYGTWVAIGALQLASTSPRAEDIERALRSELGDEGWSMDIFVAVRRIEELLNGIDFLEQMKQRTSAKAPVLKKPGDSD